MSEEKKDYGATLNLPKTEFPMRASLPENEPKVLKKLYEKNIYEKCLAKNEGNEKFVLHDGPPYANGNIHIGHALNKILKDILVRYKTMQGYYTPYIPGWDTHGLPIEKQAIKLLGVNKDEIGISKFRDTCRDFALKYVEGQKEQFKRLGGIGDWDNPYITLDPKFEARQIEIFGEMFKKGYIYKGLKPVYWCTDCETALAEAEIEYQDDKTTSIYVKFKVEDDKGKFISFTGRDIYFVIWTTTTWTLPGNTGIIISPEFDYDLVQVNNKDVFVVAHELVDNVMDVAGIEDYSVIATFKGEELDGIICRHPFLDRTSKVVMGSEDTVDVKLDTGTGCVHAAPGHGIEDYLNGLKTGLDIIVPVDNKGYLTEEAGMFKGLFYEKANEAILNHLKEINALVAAKVIEHSYPHCWRCKEPIIFRATSQWFASIEGFREKTLEKIKEVQWEPKWGEDRISSMVKDRNDWCISRQRVWGVPIPIFFCKDCEKEYVTDESIKKIADLFRKKGSNSWYELSEKELMPEGAQCSCGCKEFRKETDIMDVWFDSGTTHFAVLEEKGLWPATMYLEGNDQYRGWFQSSLLTSIAVKEESPYKIILTHGWTVDGEGRKMSKSLGNGVDPLDVINEFGADILRLWVTSTDYQSDVRISKEILKQLSEVYRKIRNTARYMLGNLSDFDPNTDMLEYDQLQELDKWALVKLNKLIRNVNKSFDKFEYHVAYQEINRFCVIDMSNIYLDIIKDRLYTLKKDDKARRSAQTVMYEILTTLTKIITPILAFTSEEIWSYTRLKDDENKESPLLAKWPMPNEKYENADLEEKWNKILELKEMVAKELEIARANKIIGHSLNAKVSLQASKKYDFLLSILPMLKEIFIVSQVELRKSDDDSNEIKITIDVAEGNKCERCWGYSTTVGENENHPTLCSKCAKVIE